MSLVENSGNCMIQSLMTDILKLLQVKHSEDFGGPSHNQLLL